MSHALESVCRAMSGFAVGGAIALVVGGCGQIHQKASVSEEELALRPGVKQVPATVLLRVPIEGRDTPIFMTAALTSERDIQSEGVEGYRSSVRKLISEIKEKGIRYTTGELDVVSGDIEVCEREGEEIDCGYFDESAAYRTLRRFAKGVVRVLKQVPSLFLIGDARADVVYCPSASNYQWSCNGYNPSCGASSPQCNFGDPAGDANQCKGDLSSCQSSLSSCQGSVTDLQGQLNQCNDNASECSAQLTMAQGQIADLQGQIASLQSQINSLEQQNMDLNTQITGLNGTIAAQQTTINSLQDQINSLTAANESLTQQNSQLASQNAALNQQVSSLTQANAQLTQANQDLQNQLSQCIGNLTECQLFPPTPIPTPPYPFDLEAAIEVGR